MSDAQPTPGPMANPPEQNQGMFKPGVSNVQLIYVLYLLGFLFGVTWIVGAIMACVSRNKVGGWIETHYTYQIRTFWMGVLWLVVSTLLAFVLIGYVIYGVAAIWFIIRCVRGLAKTAQREPIPDPQTWLV